MVPSETVLAEGVHVFLMQWCARDSPAFISVVIFASYKT